MLGYCSGVVVCGYGIGLTVGHWRTTKIIALGDGNGLDFGITLLKPWPYVDLLKKKNIMTLLQQT